MNDYKLINSLLKENSPQSLLKLKMIVDLENLQICEIKYENLFKLLNIFKEDFEIFFSICPLYIRSFPYDKKIEIIKMFKDSFEKGFSNEPSVIDRFDDKSTISIIEMFPNIKWV